MVVRHEVPGLHPGVVGFARRLIDAGRTTYLLSLAADRAMDALLTLSRPSAGLGSVLVEVAVLAGMAVVVLGVALVVFQRRALATV